MAKSRGFVFPILLALCMNSVIHLTHADLSSASEKSKLYVVYMGKNSHPSVEATHAAHHHTLSHVFESEIHALESLVYHYKHAFNGFSAMLTSSQAETLRQLPTVVSVFESKELRGQTTRSMSYLGLKPTTGLWPRSNFGSDVIIGVLDTGIWPESEMFSDEFLGPIPARWNGSCVEGENWDPKVHCNRKIIGAKWFDRGYIASLIQDNKTTGIDYIRSARDMIGHGTHCSSTAAGFKVENASLFGLANGLAVGAAPAARIAVYKILWGERGSGYDADILAAIDEAILDGVDIMSMSIAGDLTNFYSSSLSIGSYHAAEHGILVSIAAGNNGPLEFTTTNVAPWQLTVAASTTDREFRAELELGDGTIIEARAVKDFNFREEISPIVDAANIPGLNASSNQSRFCEDGSLDTQWVKGAIIICELTDQELSSKIEETVHQLGATGIVIVGPRKMFAADSGYPFNFLSSLFITQIPAVGLEVRNEVDAYLAACSQQSGCIPTGIIRRTRAVLTGVKNPVTATFSSRGPNSLAFDILKPDITAPGADILAAWAESQSALVSALTAEGIVEKTTNFKLISGTSMACPHITGIAALIKATHRDWSAAAIKSALMTTAIPFTKGNILDYGAGEVNVLQAADPGLIYDITPSDYMLFLCGQNYTETQFEALTGESISVCPNTTISLNYPSFTFSTIASESSTVRTVTNVGQPRSTYSVRIVQPSPVAVITVSPTILTFTEKNQKLSYTVSVQILLGPDSSGNLQHSQGFIIWADEDSTHVVSSPVSLWNYLP